MAKSLIDFITEEDYPRFNALLAIAEENKKNAPKPERKPRGPMSIEQKKALKMKAIEKAKAELEALMAAEDAAAAN